jgi:hypothetical protein
MGKSEEGKEKREGGRGRCLEKKYGDWQGFAPFADCNISPVLM